MLCKTEETSTEMNYVKKISHCEGNENGSNSLESYLHTSPNQISNGRSTKSVGLTDFDENFMPNLAKFVFQVKQDQQKSTELESSALGQTNQCSSEKTRTIDAEGKQDMHSIKVCTLYKPILRRFRSYLRTKFDKGRKPSIYQHWTEEIYFENVRIFMNDLKMPQELMDQDNTLKLLTILFPCSLKKIQPKQLVKVRELFSNIFRENCAQKR